MQAGPMKLKVMPAAPGTCAFCATEHNEFQPHNWWSVFYQVRFKLKWGRAATHADAVAHLTWSARDLYRCRLQERGIAWTEPPAGCGPVAEPYAESTGGT